MPDDTSGTEHIPSFSVVIETENLAAAGANDLARALADLAAQDLPPTRANEVLIVQSGDVPDALVAQLRARYPWVQVHRAPSDTDYFAAKMEGFRLTTGEIVVFWDSDCRCGRRWLRYLLTAFVRRPEVEVVSGETSIAVTGPYSLATLLTWAHPPHTGRRELYPGAHYSLNSVAFRRSTLARCPLPTTGRMYRGDGAVHEALLRRAGVALWKEPKARVQHPLPADGWRKFFWRWALFGHDLLLQERAVAAARVPRWAAAWWPPVLALLKVVSLATYKPLRRLPGAVRNDPGCVRHLPGAVVVIWAEALSALAGWVVALVRPGELLGRASARLEAGSA